MSTRCCLAIVVCLNLFGCTTIQDWHYCHVQKHRAHMAWWFGCDERCTTNPMSHYAHGWRKGYADVLMGSNGEVPPVPPQCYWDPKYQTVRGECKVENWFLGYSHGAAAALETCRGRYHDVPLSNNIRECSPGCLPSDSSPYNYGRNGLGIRTEKVPGSDVPRTNELSDGYESTPAVESSTSTPLETIPEMPPAPRGLQSEDVVPAPKMPESEPSTRVFGTSGKWTKSASMTKKWTSSVFAKILPASEEQ